MKKWAKNKKGVAEGSRSAGHRALFVKFLCFLLCFLTFFSLPTNAYAANYQPKKPTVIFSYGTLENPTKFVTKDVTIPADVNNGYINEIGFLSIQFYDTGIDCKSGDLINISLEQTYKRYSFDFNCVRSSISGYDKDGKQIYFGKNSARYDASSMCFVYENISVPQDVTNISFGFSFEPQKVKYGSGWDNTRGCGVGLGLCNVVVESEQTGFFNSVKEFFRELFQKLKSGIDNIGSWFSELGNKITSSFTELGNKLRDFFTDLINNIKEQFQKISDNLKKFFDNVGQWFKDIGDRIGDFFTNLWNNITDKIESITNAIKEWWQGVVDFFHSLFVPEDGYFDRYKKSWEDWAKEHFALFYDVMAIFDEIIGEFKTGQETTSLVIVLPEIQLPIFDHPIIMEETRIDLGELYTSHSAFKYFYDLYRLAFSGFCYFLLIKYLQRTLSEIIAGDGDTL